MNDQRTKICGQNNILFLFNRNKENVYHLRHDITKQRKIVLCKNLTKTRPVVQPIITGRDIF